MSCFKSHSEIAHNCLLNKIVFIRLNGCRSWDLIFRYYKDNPRFNSSIGITTQHTYYCHSWSLFKFDSHSCFVSRVFECVLTLFLNKIKPFQYLRQLFSQTFKIISANAIATKPLHVSVSSQRFLLSLK